MIFFFIICCFALSLIQSAFIKWNNPLNGTKTVNFTKMIQDEYESSKFLSPSTPIWNPEAMNRNFTTSGEKLWEGDMILSDEQVRGLSQVSYRKAVDDLRKRWPHGIIYYRFLPSSEPDREVILSALQHWRDNTCLKFIEVDANFDAPHIYFNRSIGCSSGVGMNYKKNGQEVSIGKDCLVMGKIAHELGHVIGFYHEQNRRDRDQYIRIIKDNVFQYFLVNFEIAENIDYYGVEYDLTSVMHYGLDFFSSNGKKTILPLDPTKEFQIGQRKGLSFNDIKLANIMYNCEEHCDKKPNCQNGGFVTHNCECRCPPQFTGNNCLTPAPHQNSCGSVITFPTMLTSPNYPMNYPKESRCIWIIKAPPGRKIRLLFNDFDLFKPNSYGQCEQDYLEIRSADTTDGRKFCKDQLKNTTLFFHFNKLLLAFKADNDKNKGFHLNIEFV